MRSGRHLFAGGIVSGKLHKAIAPPVEVCYLGISGVTAQWLDAGRWIEDHRPSERSGASNELLLCTDPPTQADVDGTSSGAGARQ